MENLQSGLVKSDTRTKQNLLWLVKLRNGNEAAFEALFYSYKDKIFAFSYRLLKSKDLADDAVIEVFTRVWEKRSRIDPDRSFECYLYTIARNYIINLLKKSSSDLNLQKKIFASTDASMNSTESELIYQDYMSLTKQMINQMPLQRRRVFKLRSEQGMTYEQIAHKIGLSKNTVKSHLKAATTQLRSFISTIY